MYQIKTFWNLLLQFAGKCISKTLSDCRSLAWTLFVCSGSNFSWNFRVSRGVLKKSLSFITQFKIEFSLLFTCCRKVFWKMPGLQVHLSAECAKIVSWPPCYLYSKDGMVWPWHFLVNLNIYIFIYIYIYIYILLLIQHGRSEKYIWKGSFHERT